jgi:hypothetical protein
MMAQFEVRYLGIIIAIYWERQIETKKLVWEKQEYDIVLEVSNFLDGWLIIIFSYKKGYAECSFKINL